MTLPIAVRELRVAASSRRTYRARLYIAGAGMVSTFWILYNLLQFSGRRSYQIGQEMFTIQAWALFAIAAFSGVGATSDCISNEKRTGTLGLLFLTHLKGRDIVLGKLAAHTMGSFFGLLAILPILTIPVLLGGVGLPECLRVLLVILDMLFVAAAAGLFVSSFTRSQQQSQGWAVLLVVFLTLGPPLIGKLLRFYQVDSDACLALELTSPIVAQFLAFGSLAGIQATYFTASCALIFGTGMLFIAAAAYLTPRCWQDKAHPSLNERLRARFASWRLGRIQSRSALGRSLLDRNPFLWLVSHQSDVRTSVWLYTASIAGLALLLMVDLSRHNDPTVVHIAVCLPCAYLLNIGLKVRIGGWASFRLAEARENGALELLLSTPLKVDEIVSGHIAGVKRVFGWVTFVIGALISIAFMLSLPGFDRLISLFAVGNETGPYRFRAVVLLLCALVFLILDGFALVWCGIWLGFRSKNPGQARGLTMLLGLLVPLLLYPVLFPILNHVSSLQPFFKQPEFYSVLGFFAGVAAVSDLGLMLFARRQILKHARALAQSTTSNLDPSRFERIVSKWLRKPKVRFSPDLLKASPSQHGR